MLKEKKELERGAVLEIAGARSAEDKIGGWSAERKGEKGLERGAVLTPGPLPSIFVSSFCHHGFLRLVLLNMKLSKRS